MQPKQPNIHQAVSTYSTKVKNEGICTSYFHGVDRENFIDGQVFTRSSLETDGNRSSKAVARICNRDISFEVGINLRRMWLKSTEKLFQFLEVCDKKNSMNDTLNPGMKKREVIVFEAVTVL